MSPKWHLNHSVFRALKDIEVNDIWTRVLRVALSEFVQQLKKAYFEL
jgi:hypothetical protein